MFLGPISNEMKIFITFLLIFGMFSHWTGWNEESRFALTRSIVEENSLNINSYANYTGDRAFFDGNYYSDKAPGSSSINTPFYLVWQGVSDGSPDSEVFIADKELEERRNVTIYYKVDPNLELSIARFLSVFFLSAFPGALLVVLIYKTSKLITDNKKSLFVAIVFGLGTIILAYSTVYMGVITASTFSFLSFFLLIKSKEVNCTKILYFLAGLLMSFAVFIEYYAVLFVFVFALYLILTRLIKGLGTNSAETALGKVNIERKTLAIFVFGMVVGLTPLFTYNSMIFEGFLEFSTAHIDTDIWISLETPTAGNVFQIISMENILLNLPRLTFSPFRGIFFYSPILLVSIPGLYILFKKKSDIAVYITLIFLSFISFNAFLVDWHAGASFGPRYLVPVVPFLAVPFTAMLDKFGKNKIFVASLVILVPLSVFHSFSAFNNWTGPDMDMEEYRERMQSFRPLGNPIYDHYIPEFMENGPRSQVLAGIVTGELDLTFHHQNSEKVPITSVSRGILAFRIPFLSLILVFLIFLCFWYKEFLRTLSKHIPWHPTLTFLLIILLLGVLAQHFFTLTEIHFSGFYEEEEREDENRTFRWMESKGKLYLSTNYVPLRPTANAWSYMEEATIEVLSEDKEITSYNLTRWGESLWFPIIVPERGLKMELFSLDGCEYFESDPRCLSIALSNFTKNKDKDLLRLIDDTDVGWYGLETLNNQTFRWISDQAHLDIFNSAKENKSLTMSITSYRRNRVLEIDKNGQNIVKEEIGQRGFTDISVSLVPGRNRISFEAEEGCDKPPDIEDDRCLSFGFNHVEVG